MLNITADTHKMIILINWIGNCFIFCMHSKCITLLKLTIIVVLHLCKHENFSYCHELIVLFFFMYILH